MKWKSAAAFLALGLFAIFAPAVADDRVEIGVTFAVKAQHYSDAFSSTEAADLKAKADDAIVAALGRHIKFVNFTTNATAPYRLDVILARADRRDVPGPSDFGFHMRLSGPDVSPAAQSYTIFRTADRFLEPVGSVDALAREIEESFNTLDHRGFVTSLLGDIPIADNAEFKKNQASWIISRDRVALCIGYQSLLKVQSQIPFGDQTRREWFVARVIDVPTEPTRIFAETPNDPTSNAHLLQDVDESKVKVERVAVSDYLLCQAPVPVSDVDFFASGGDQ